MSNRQNIHNKKPLYNEFTPKQKRIIKKDIELVCSLKGLYLPKTIKELEDREPFPITIKLNENVVIISKEGVTAIRRVCDLIYQSKKYEDLLGFNDIFRAVVTELERWINDDIVPDDFEFIEPLEAVLYGGIADYYFVCRVNGFLLDGIDNIVIGNKEVKIYDPKNISSLPRINEVFHKRITEEFANKLVIIGTEKGSQAIAQEKFYHNAELALSVFRLYSCALYGSAIHDIKIQLIPDCDRSHNRSGCFFWSNTEESLVTLTGYLGLKQDFNINPELIEELNSNYFFNEVSRIIEKKGKNELENRVVRSLFWIGEAQKDQSYASAWVKLWSCIECFFVFGKCEVTERNAQGVASILVYGGYSHKQYNDYQTLKTKIKKYYGLRSKIVHHAGYTHINKELLEELSFMVAWVIITMASFIDRGYTSFADVHMQIDRLDKL